MRRAQPDDRAGNATHAQSALTPVAGVRDLRLERELCNKALLAPDERLAGFALGMERVEVLFQPLLGGFAGIDRTAERADAAPGVAGSSLVMTVR